MNLDKLKAELERLNLRQQQTEQKARDLQTKITKADRAYQTRRKVILGAWALGLLNVDGARQQLRGFIKDKDKELFPDLFTPDEMEAAKTSTDTVKANDKRNSKTTTRE